MMHEVYNDARDLWNDHMPAEASCDLGIEEVREVGGGGSDWGHLQGVIVLMRTFAEDIRLKCFSQQDWCLDQHIPGMYWSLLCASM